MKILITGSNGLLGYGLRRMEESSHHDLVFISRDQCDLTDYNDVDAFFKFSKEGPFDYVIHTAGRVGGIGRNLNSPAQQFHENIMVNTNVIHAAYKNNIKRLVAFTSTCAFPENATPFTESNFHVGEPFPAHRYYAYAKRMADIQIEAYRKQYKCNYTCIIPGNLFGEHDNYNLDDGHVIPSLIHKAFIAKNTGVPFEVWGDGSSQREFVYSYDLARACLRVIDLPGLLPERMIISSNKEYKIKDIAESIGKFMGVSDIKWLTDKPNGQKSRPSKKDLFNKLIPDFTFTDMDEALKLSCEWFTNNYDVARK